MCARNTDYIARMARRFEVRKCGHAKSSSITEAIKTCVDSSTVTPLKLKRYCWSVILASLHMSLSHS